MGLRRGSASEEAFTPTSASGSVIVGQGRPALTAV